MTRDDNPLTIIKCIYKGGAFAWKEMDIEERKSMEQASRAISRHMCRY